MIAELKGVLTLKEPGECVVDVHGVGFAVSISSRTEAHLGSVGETVRLYTHLIVREDEWRLTGFLHRIERRRFLELLAVNGVGAKVALAILGVLGVDGLEQAIHEGQWQRLKAVPGVGAKLAQRVQLELSSRWKVDAEAESAPVIEDSGDEVVAALVGLGYTLEEALLAVRGLEPGLETAERLRQGLRALDAHKGGRAHG